MALRRRLAYGFSGFEVPVVPRALRSARGKIPIRKTQERNPVQAFEILASVAGELLQELESSDPQVACEEDQNNIVVMEKQDEKNFLKAEPEHGFACGLPRHHAIYQVKKLSHTGKFFSYHTGKFFSFEINSVSKGFDQPKTICFPDHERTARGSCFATIDGKLSCSGKFSRGHAISAIETKSIARQSILQSRWSEKLCFATKWSRFKSRNASRGPFGKLRGTSLQSGNLVRKSRVDSKELLKKPPAFVSPRSGSEYLFRGTKTSFPNYFADLARRDDDDNSLRGSQPGTIMKVHWPSPNVVHQRINNLSGSRHWRASPIMKDWKRKPVYCNGYGRSCNAKQRSLRNFPLKRRKTFKRIPISMTDGGFHYKDIFNSLTKGSSDDNNCCAVNEPSSSIGAQQAPPEPYSRACKVKYSIKSIKVPEIFIEIPSSATVGSLKRMVMEAVTTALVDGLHVGVLLQGKKVRDDSETLHQTGIPHDDKHHDSGFVLGSEPAQNAPPPSTEDCGDSDPGMPGHMVSLSIQSVPADVNSLPQLMNTGGSLDNNSIAVESVDETFINDTMPDSQARVVVPAVAMEALAVVPLQKKSKHHELVQRRTRRPFSVLEVEALVQAVEKLGTGRWRDIKLRAFDSAEHRTYVDLKDKWKTLVHTARISPQQRRGEPVPQQLLDRVLAAHAFWSEQQPQAQLKVAI